MRTTLNLADSLVASAKEQADAEGRTLTSFIEEAMRARLESQPDRRSAVMPTFGGGVGRGLLVDLLDRDAVDEALGEQHP